MAVVTDDPAEAHRSPVDLALLAAPGGRLRGAAHASCPSPRARPPGPWSARLRRSRRGRRAAARRARAGRARRARCRPTRSWSRRRPRRARSCRARLPARRPLGFLSAAMGGLGFGLSAPIGVRMALPARPVVAVVGDGSSMYVIQALWSAARYEVGAIFVVLANGGYRVMDRLAEPPGAAGAVARLRRARHRRDGARPGLRGAARRDPRRSSPRRSTARFDGHRERTSRCCSRSSSRPTTRSSRPSRAPAGWRGPSSRGRPAARPRAYRRARPTRSARPRRPGARRQVGAAACRRPRPRHQPAVARARRAPSRLAACAWRATFVSASETTK